MPGQFGKAIESLGARDVTNVSGDDNDFVHDGARSSLVEECFRRLCKSTVVDELLKHVVE